jgi:cysteinyl-tRNA synthetase
VPNEVLEPLNDDLNIPKAIAALHQLKKENRNSELLASFRLLGFSGDSTRITRKISVTVGFNLEVGATVSFDSDNIPEAVRESIDKKVAARNEARKAKNFAESDRIRDELLAQGIVLKDGPNGTTWEIKR